MPFFSQANYFVMSPETDYTWQSRPIRVTDVDVDYSHPQVEWGKIARISDHEYLYCMGAAHVGQDFFTQQGSKDVLKLDIKSGRLTKLTESSEKFMAHQVIFLKPTPIAPKGSLYVFGG